MLDIKVFDFQIYIYFKNNEVSGSIRKPQMFDALKGCKISFRGIGGGVEDLVFEITYFGEGRPITFNVIGIHISEKERHREVSSAEEFIRLLNTYGYNDDTREFIAGALNDLSELL